MSCSGGRGDDSPTPPKKSRQLSDTTAHCYLWQQQKDSIWLELRTTGDSLRGWLRFGFHEKDNSYGAVAGTWYGDTAIAIYTYYSEGIKSQSEIALLRQGGRYLLGSGPQAEREGSMVFTDRRTISFNHPLEPVSCDLLPRATGIYNRVQLKEFTAIPSAIEGCSCIFAVTESKFRDNTYIFASDYKGNAVVQGGDSMIYLRSDPGSHIHKGKTEVSYHNGSLRLYLKMTARWHRGDETWWYEGKLELRDTVSGAKYVYPLAGECGC